MTGPLSHEPSVQAIVAHVLPDSARVLSGTESLRRRASLLIHARATGLGEIEGGEIILVPEGRAAPIVARLRELESAGIAGVIVAGEVDLDPKSLHDSAMPVIVVPGSTDMRRLQSDLERYIARRRRELFSLEHALHRSLTEAAIGGAELERLLAAASTQAGRTVALDRDGDMLVYPARDHPVSDVVLVQARMTLHGIARGTITVAGPPESIAAPVFAGSDRRGIVLVLGIDSATLDEDEAILTTLASACAIAMARVPVEPLRQLASILESLANPNLPFEVQGWQSIVAVALHDSDSTSRQLAHALGAELTLRDIDHVAGVERDSLVMLASASADRVSWENVFHAMSLRLGTHTVRAGLGRHGTDTTKVAQRCREAFDALTFSEDGRLTRFQEIELASLLRTTGRWLDFARGQLGPLLDGSASNDDLVRTLKAYLATGRNAKEAARDLHVHRNTLLYRLRRIQQILSVDLEDQDILFGLDLALRILASAAPTSRIMAEIGDIH